MYNFEQLDGIERFKKCIADIFDEDIATVSVTIYGCMELFKAKYEDKSIWLGTASNQTEWFDYLATLAKDILVKEINHELPFGTTNGVYMLLLFYKAVAIKDDELFINAMSDYLGKFYRIGQQISNNSVMESSVLNSISQQSNVVISVH